MTAPRKPLLDVLSGTSVWPPPIWLMRQAGRYLPEYRQVRDKAGDFIALCTSPDLAAEVTLQPIRRYGFDAAILFSDILMVPWALGHGLRFAVGEGPILPRIDSNSGIDALQPDRLPQAIAPILETVRRVRAGLAREGFDRTSLIGFAGSPFTVACYMVEGGGSRDFARTRLMAFERPALFDRLMAVLTQATIAFLSAQIDAGAEAVKLFGSWDGVLPPSLFDRYAIAPARAIVTALRERHPTVPVIGFPRLAGTRSFRYAERTGVAALALDTAADLRQPLPAGVAVQGNLDPMALVAGGTALATETAAILEAQRGRPAIFNLGHGIVPETPPDHVARLVSLVRAG